MTPDSHAAVGDFFSKISVAYDQSIMNAVPPYQEMLENLLGYLFYEQDEPLQILELGSGSGNLSQLLTEYYPNATLTAVDLSQEMLDLTRQKIARINPDAAMRFVPVQQNFLSLKFPENSFDVVISSIALHHLLDPDKREIYHKLHRWLKPGGRFRCADECLAQPGAAQETNLRRWLAWSRKIGASEEELEMWVEHSEKYDHYAPLHQHFKWLEEAGFVAIDCHWRQLYWTVFGAEKSPTITPYREFPEYMI